MRAEILSALVTLYRRSSQERKKQLINEVGELFGSDLVRDFWKVIVARDRYG